MTSTIYACPIAPVPLTATAALSLPVLADPAPIDDYDNDGDVNDVITLTSGIDRVNTGKGHDVVHGLGGSDTIYGGKGADTLFGDAGADTLRGNEGNDTLFGGSGNDKLYGDEGNDTLFGGAGHDKLYGGSGNDRLYGGADNDVLKGDAGADKLYGQDGLDTLCGGAGGDLISGGQGADTLYGGAGKDVFVYESTTESNVIGDLDNPIYDGRDVIKDFEHGDKIDLPDIVKGFADLGIEVKDGVTSISASDGVIHIVAEQFTVFLEGEFTLTADDFIFG